MFFLVFSKLVPSEILEFSNIPKPCGIHVFIPRLCWRNLTMKRSCPLHGMGRCWCNLLRFESCTKCMLHEII
jgi:hypothetical protein